MTRALPFFVVLGGILVFIVVLVRAVATPSARRRGVGAGASGAVYDMLNEDKRKAIEIVVEDRAAATDPEHADDKPKAGM